MQKISLVLVGRINYMKLYVKAANLNQNEFIDDDPEVRESAAKNSNTLPNILSQLAYDVDPTIRYYVAQNPNTPSEALARLVDDKNGTIRWAITQNPDVSAELLSQLANDQSVFIRKHVASNLNTSAEILSQLACDVDSSVRSEVALNPNTPVPILVKLSDDRDDKVRVNVARNRSAPHQLMVNIACRHRSQSSGKIISSVKEMTDFISDHNIIAGVIDYVNDMDRAWNYDTPELFAEACCERLVDAIQETMEENGYQIKRGSTIEDFISNSIWEELTAQASSGDFDI